MGTAPPPLAEDRNGVGMECTQRPRRARPLSLPGLIAIIYYSVCGGPFGTEDVVQAAGPLFALLGFLIMPIVWSVPEALIAAELATAFPSNSGYVTWVSAAFGPFWGFQEGFLSWLCAVFDTAIYPVLFRHYLSNVLPAIDGGVPGYIFVVGFSVALTLLNYRGLSIVGWAAFALCIFTVLPFVYIVIVGLPQVKLENVLLHPPLADVEWTSYLNVLFWNLNYWDTASTLAGEVESPRTTFPKALTITMLLVFASYFLPLLVGVGISGPGGGQDWHRWTEGSLVQVGARIGGAPVKVWVVIASGVSNVGQFVSEQAACAYQLQGMADLGWLPSCFARRSRYETPPVGLSLSFLIVVALCTFDFQSIVELLNGIYCMAQLLEFAAFIQLRRAYPSLRRPFRVPLRSTLSCCLLLLAPTLFCILMLVMPVVTGNWLQVGFLVFTPLAGVSLHKCLGLCRRRHWVHFSREPPRSVEELLAVQTPMSSATGPTARTLSGSFEEILLEPAMLPVIDETASPPVCGVS